MQKNIDRNAEIEEIMQIIDAMTPEQLEHALVLLQQWAIEKGGQSNA